MGFDANVSKRDKFIRLSAEVPKYAFSSGMMKCSTTNIVKMCIAAILWMSNGEIGINIKKSREDL